MISICDRLIEDEKRRRYGGFFTPTLWVDEAHRMISEAFGDDWKEKYVVWDPACGTLNLTRDYKFKELYASTLLQEELDIAIQNHVNPEAVRFQFDFLNDSFDKLPEGLKKAIEEGREIIFFLNPPYGTANNAGTKIGDHKAGIAKTVINKEMKEQGWGACAQQLYAQFLYRIWKVKNTKIAFFSPPLYKSGGSYKKFRDYFYDRFEYVNGMLFNASHFSDTAASWGVDFSLWKQGKEKRSELPIIVKDIDIGEVIKKVQQKSIYNLDSQVKASDWVRKEVKGKKTYDAPQVKSGIQIAQKGRGKSVKGHIGYFGSNGNSVYDNPNYVFLLCECSSCDHGLSIIPENYKKVISLFTARRTIKQNWINDKDEYMAPNTDHPEYEQWNNDAVVYSLFNTKSNQSSLRNITYKDKLWDIQNEFFWMSVDEMKSLADEHNNLDVYNDVKKFGKERYVFTLLKTTPLSPDAQEVLNMASELVRKTFKYREILNEEHPNYHLEAWDLGFYQIKLILKAYMKEDLKNFRILYKKFEDRMREGVYKFGFLK